MKLDPPALFTTMSTKPSCSMAAATAPATACWLVTSAGITNALRPRAVMSDAVSASPSSLRATSATSAPAAASPIAIDWPIPRDAPVTNAFLPDRSKGLTRQSFHSAGSGQAAGLRCRTISFSTIRTYGSPTHRCLARSPTTSSACGTRANRARASSGRR